MRVRVRDVRGGGAEGGGRGRVRRVMVVGGGGREGRGR